MNGHKETIHGVSAFRLHGVGDRSPVALSAGDKELIESQANEYEAKLKDNYEPGFGIFPAKCPDENYCHQMWTRDFAQAGADYFATRNPEAFKDSLRVVFSHQHEKGMLPLRVEKEYMI